jgi:hypothetical protein
MGLKSETALSRTALSLIIHPQDYGFVSIVAPTIDTTIPKKATIIVSPSESVRKVFRKIVAAYVVGYERIYLEPPEGKSPLSGAVRKEIAQLARDKLYGIEISRNDEEQLEIAVNVATIRPIETLQEMCKQAMSMYERAIGKIISGGRVWLEGTFKGEARAIDEEVEALKDIEKEDDAVDRRHHYGTRNLKRALIDPRLMRSLGPMNPRVAMGYRLIEKDVERIADHSERIAATYREYISSRPKSPKDREAYNALVETIKARDKQVKELFSRMHRALMEEGEKAFNDANDAIEYGETVALELRQIEEQHKEWHHRRMLESMRRIVDYTIGIGEIILNLHINSILQIGEKTNQEQIVPHALALPRAPYTKDTRKQLHQNS